MATRRRRPPPEYADPASVEQFASTMPSEFVNCRGMTGHNWRPHDAKYVPREKVHEAVLRCSNCATLRRLVLDAVGRVLSNSYSYPDGYQSKGLGRIAGDGRAVLRLASVIAVEDKQQPTSTRKRSSRRLRSA